MKSWKDSIDQVSSRQWIKAGFWGLLYVFFVLWVSWGDWKSLGWLALLPVVLDMFTTRFIPWTWWHRYKPMSKEDEQEGRVNPYANVVLYTICSWIDAIVFAVSTARRSVLKKLKPT